MFGQLYFQNLLRIQLHLTIPTWTRVQATIILHLMDYCNSLLADLSAYDFSLVLSSNQSASVKGKSEDVSSVLKSFYWLSLSGRAPLPSITLIF